MSVVRFEILDRIGLMTIDRPEARNAVDGEVAQAVEAAIDRLEADDALWVGIITGTPPAFCAGADLKATRAGTGKSMFTKRGGFAGFTARERTKPVIAAVDGPALAGGTEIVLACDLVVASFRATFGLPEVKRSLVASAGGLFRLGRKVPFNVAMECALTGDPITAARAYELGLANIVCPDDKAVEAAVSLGRAICANAPLAVRESRDVMLSATAAPDEVGWQRSRAALRRVQASDDYLEGLTAFAEKRSPRWKGR
jgi:enoyl-CoA hydratase